MTYLLPNDSRLAVAAQGGDVAAFNQLYEFYWPKLVGCLRAHGATPEDAEDATQTAMMRVWVDFSQHPDRVFSTFKQWVYRIGCNAHTDVVRRPLYKLTDPFGRDPVYCHNHELLYVAEALVQLKECRPAAYETLMLYVSGNDQSRIASYMNTTRSAVKSSVQRARAYLRGNYA